MHSAFNVCSKVIKISLICILIYLAKFHNSKANTLSISNDKFLNEKNLDHKAKFRISLFSE